MIISYTETDKLATFIFKDVDDSFAIRTVTKYFYENLIICVQIFKYSKENIYNCSFKFDSNKVVSLKKKFSQEISAFQINKIVR